MKERDLQQPVHKWLSADGHTKIIYEFMMAGYCDMVGILFAERIGRAIPPVVMASAVELKLDDVAGVLQQAWENRHFVHASYAAMPKERCRKMRPATKRQFLGAGIGLLSVSTSVEVVIPPGKPMASLNTEDFRTRWWSRIVRDERVRR